MRVIRVREVGPPQVLKIEEAAELAPGVGQVVVAVERAGVIYADTIVRSGRFPFPRPFVPGHEVAGTVTAVGPEVDSSLLGRRVVATTVGMSGGYAEQALAEAVNVHPVPDGLALEHAVAVFSAGAVAVGLLGAMPVSRGETVVVTAAAGRIGLLLVQLAKAAGATVIGAAGGPEKLAAARESGADAVVDYRTADWAGQVRELTGGGADLVLDAIGGDIGAQAFDALADGRGRLGVYGFTSGTWTAVDMPQLLRRGLTVAGPMGMIMTKTQAAQRADVEHALNAASAGQLIPRIHAAYLLENAAQAHEDLEQRRIIGAIHLVVG
ncbi:zinc-binding dehydrogenase [Amycolatopsis taiwanensis]|uniref:NADPH:quinone reductase n=1 Tax=Amycolatopsis taiwanensis TaxID=342230 RepID=A0A9W6VH55_9PSEU|nr:zinc-binding dehydrogenase [Amycolatopsis taiwanensis]GLY66684.1 NADPH:quinone reductase [Amycolatopsis taiwanensis]